MDVDSSIPDQLRYSGFATRGPLLRLAEGLERYALRRSATAITVCASLTDGVKARAPELPVFQVEDPPLVEPGTTAAPEAVEALRRALTLGPWPVVLYSGNFEPYQGVELLLEGLALVPQVQLLLMGGGAGDVARMKAEARARGVGERTIFSGPRPPSELPLFLALADVLASPRVKGQNTPFKVFTYLAAGKPLVATRIPTHTQLLDDTTAFLVEPTPRALAAGLQAALGHPEEASARARAARELVEREYSVERYREKIARAYAEVERLTAR
jgi:glycosyltransferase involved in cell wall biosynthesis